MENKVAWPLFQVELANLLRVYKIKVSGASFAEVAECIAAVLIEQEK